MKRTEPNPIGYQPNLQPKPRGVQSQLWVRDCVPHQCDYEYAQSINLAKKKLKKKKWDWEQIATLRYQIQALRNNEQLSPHKWFTRSSPSELNSSTRPPRQEVQGFTNTDAIFPLTQKVVVMKAAADIAPSFRRHHLTLTSFS